MSRGEPQTVRQVIGQNARRIREGAGARQDDVASRARRQGLAWSRSKIAALERGEKALSLEETILLASVLGGVSGTEVRLADLFNGGEDVILSDRITVLSTAVQRFLAGSPVVIRVRDSPDMTARMRDALRGWTGQLQRVSDLLGNNDVGAELVEEVMGRAGEAEQRAARNLGVQTYEVGALSAGLWGRTLTEERDRRAGEHDDQASLRARRGRVTRELLAELRTRLQEVEDGVDPEEA